MSLQAQHWQGVWVHFVWQGASGSHMSLLHFGSQDVAGLAFVFHTDAAVHGCVPYGCAFLTLGNAERGCAFSGHAIFKNTSVYVCVARPALARECHVLRNQLARKVADFGTLLSSKFPLYKPKSILPRDIPECPLTMSINKTS